MSPDLAIWIPWFPAIAAVLCGLCCLRPALRRFAGPICVLSVLAGFVITLGLWAGGVFEPATGVHAWTWMAVGDFSVGFSYYLDPLTLMMLMVVTGIGSLVALYAVGYMAGDPGIARFFAGVSLFIFAMATLVMADNLVLLYLGWEGVGLCSFLLIGYYYGKPSAVAAAKKAFIVNRIGDFGFLLGIFLCYQVFDTVSLVGIIHHAREMVTGGIEPSTAAMWIPFLLMLGAFGKSAQFPLYVWLPDAMEGPTPVSALIHAATMVTAGVYLIARMLPVFQLSPYALPTVCVIGALTALIGATIALCQYDIKRIFAYSTVSQLGYMFMGVGALSASSGLFHLVTHGFFKALLFLTAGSVMHAMAGQLDLRKMSGLRRKMPVTCWLMFIGCLALAGVPPLAGFWSKDEILGSVMAKGMGAETSGSASLYIVLAVVGLYVALLTAFYTFRLWFRVFLGPEHFEMGQDPHGEPHATEPHEVSWFPMNLPLVVLALGAIASGGWLYFNGGIEHVAEMSTAHAAGQVEHAAEGGATIAGLPLHAVMMGVSSLISLAGVALAAYFHWFKRPAADRVARKFPAVLGFLQNKLYVDEVYQAGIVGPLRLLGYAAFVFDQLVVAVFWWTVGFAPRLVGRGLRPAQSGKLQGYGLGMAFGLALILLLVFMAIT